MIIECPANMRLQDYLLSQDIHILTACGGRGNCGKCRVKVLKGEDCDQHNGQDLAQ